jgi:hypothetical protein
MIAGQALLICLALALNYKQRSMLILTLFVGAGMLTPLPVFETPLYWYSSCVLVEGLVLASAMCLNNRLSFPIIICSIILTYTHLCGMTASTSFLGGSYEYSVVCLEYTEIIACILFSNTTINLLVGVRCLVHPKYSRT